MRLSPIYRWLSLVTVLVAAVAIVACDSGGSADGGGSIQFSGRSAKDREIASRLRAYVERFCSGEATSPPKRGSKAERYLIRIYGSVDAYLERVRHTCASYQLIRVKHGVITVKTTLASTDAENAADICDTIQGSDVADFTPGHSVLDEDDEVLVRCRARKLP